MNNSIYIFAFLLLFTFSCGKKSEKEGSTNTLEGSAAAGSSENSESSLANRAILLWDASIINDPSKEGKWVASYQFGNTLTLTGESEENKDEKRTYLEVTGPDGKTGWINDYLVISNSSVGVATSDISLFKNPDIMSATSDKIKEGDLVAISAVDKSGFHQIFGKEKKIKGFVNTIEKITSDPTDLKVALFYHKALAKKTKEEQVKELQSIVDDASNSSSKVIEIVRAKLSELDDTQESNKEESVEDTTTYD